MSPRIGALFAGYGGLDEGVRQVYGGEVAWYSEIDKGALKILSHRYPGVPNVGSVTEADWSQVEPVDILTGGSPCQDLSHAGKRQGMTEGTRSNLWVAMREAIAQLRPQIVVWENVRGAFSAAADSEVEPCPGCVGDGSGVHLRALGRVLGDLSDLGYDARWHGLRAADVGAPHGRFRVFVVATDTHQPSGRVGLESGGAAGQGGCGEGEARSGVREVARGGAGNAGLLPTPRASDGTKGGPNQRGSSGDLMLSSAVALLGTPRASEWKGSGPEGSKSHAHMLDREYLSAQVLSLLPTPTSSDAKASGSAGYGGNEFCTLTDATVRGKGGMPLLPTPLVGSDTAASHGQISGQYCDAMAEALSRWGDYAQAIARWEPIVGRPAPEPTMLSTKGNPQLSPRFVEWLMGLEDGWVTDVPGITRNEALKALGNGVVPQQAAEALRVMASWSEVAA